jgi:hypothetical protein
MRDGAILESYDANITLGAAKEGCLPENYKKSINNFIRREKDMSSADVLIQAGHEGRTTGSTGAASDWGSELEWNPIVANEATRILREAGVSVIRENAFLSEGDYDVALAVFIHFDGDNPSCGSGASVGYNDPSDQPAAREWKAIYGKYWPFRWMEDNFTTNLSGYYGFAYTNTTDAEFVIELGELTCEKQAEWLKPRLKWLGALLAYFLSQRLGKGNVPDPGAFERKSRKKSAPAWSTLYAGINLEDYPIPREGLKNNTLYRTLGVSREPLGIIYRHVDQDFVKGKVSYFGGPKDHYMAPDETVALTGEYARDLAEDDYYVAMRWDYKGQKKFWVNRHVLVVNPVNDKAVIVRAIDWGPNTRTGRILDVSAKTLDYLEAQTDDELICAFSNTDNALRKVGPVTE